MCGGRILVEKRNVYEGHNFPEAITTKMQIGNDFLVLKYPVNCKQGFLKFSLFLFKLI